MAKTTDAFALNEWLVIGRLEDATHDKPRVTRLLGQDIRAERTADGAIGVWETDLAGNKGRALPVQERYGHIFVTLGDTPRDLLEMPEFEEEGRRLVTIGYVRVKTSPLRVVENFLDLGHFPYVHTNYLGAEPQTEVANYKAEIREDVDEVWATDCSFFQQKAAKSATDGQQSEYEYRVTSPFITVLYKTCPIKPGAWDLVGLFVQPLDEDLCEAHSFVLPFDEENTDVELRHFQQTIFLQDRPILENQLPALLPLTPGTEMPARADATSMTYRRWLKKKNITFGVQKDAASTNSRAA
ncbi:MAG: aromatic ring-hydroxylating dioxygenase subunit alpha [Alphaproteobacteria bacterium]|jgi:phenylpropionate dioxygenase-like ring-hydroxylating dioxygenase large terminal subunit|nr:aromatic ring-hydroxylating dioxygenase subunit alpha [Alphaproteobacteria bacterium]MBT4082758.1 aromatic ring-hydroxylating dioxygenase subunit alpha [Alphaproteobacteria bacterium]MBT4543987.1 aromatic ring-hydroxylating dioxygenase subunit alpha [Alphaproteobacteria bacterium]MBT7745174.1 aromatic ring-hydroxylating dioxygenase subunit alpha [Alphaproteobacteria bacterium]